MPGSGCMTIVVHLNAPCNLRGRWHVIKDPILAECVKVQPARADRASCVNALPHRSWSNGRVGIEARNEHLREQVVHAIWAQRSHLPDVAEVRPWYCENRRSCLRGLAAPGMIEIEEG